MAFLFGDQLLLTLLAFGATFWVSSKLAMRNMPLVAVAVLAFLAAMFLSDFGVFLANDAVGALAALAAIVLLAQYSLGASLVESAAIIAVAWVMGAWLVYYVF